MSLAANGGTYTDNYGIVYEATGNGDATCKGVPEQDRAGFTVHNLTILSEVTIDDIKRRVTDIAAHAFEGCVNITGDLVIPETFRNIKEYAFAGCTGFDGELTLSSNLITLKEGAFQGCSGFKGDLVIPEKVQTLDKYIFDGCSGFDGKLTLNNNSNNNYIWDGAFRNCSGFTGDLVIPDNIALIQSYAFQNCAGFDGTLSLNENLKTISESAFAGCSGFTGELRIPASMSSISYYAFDGCTGFDKLTFEEGINGLYKYAFFGCTGFKGDLILPESLTIISDHVFAGCTGFDGDLKLSPNVDLINASAFEGCTGFKGALVIPEGIKKLWTSAFKNCTGFSSISLPQSLENIQSSVFENCTGLKGALNLPSSLTTLGGTAFFNCSGLTGAVKIPEGITTIGYETFQNCTGIEEFILHDNITDIGFYAFKNTNGKIVVDGAVRLPNSLKTTSTETFRDCKGLTGDLILPSSLTTIGRRCFYGTGLTGVVIPSDINCTIDMGAFSCIGSLEWVISLSDTPPMYMSEFTDMDTDVKTSDETLHLTANYPVYVHSQAVDAYRETVVNSDKILPILAVEDIDMLVEWNADITYSYQPELSEETHNAIMALSVPHKGLSIDWEHVSNHDWPSENIMTLADDNTPVISFDKESLSVTGLKDGYAVIKADDGVNVANTTVRVYLSTTGVENVADNAATIDVNGIKFPVDASSEVTVTVYNIAGKAVYGQAYAVGNSDIRLEELMPGTYIVNVASAGHNTSAKMIVRQ